MTDLTFTFSDGETVKYTHVRPVQYAFRILDKETGQRVRSIGYSTNYKNAVRAVRQSLRSLGDSERNGFVIYWPASPTPVDWHNAQRKATKVGYTAGDLRAFVKDHNERVLEHRHRLCDVEIVGANQVGAQEERAA